MADILLNSGSVHTSRIPSLDGLRAISILLVILSHLSGGPGFFDFGPLLSDSMGNLGVRTFFVISGFLITSLLLQEESKYGRIRLRNFYVRRIARIIPAFYVYIFALAAAAGLGFILIRLRDLVEAATYTADYFTWPAQSNYVRHIWSLSVEEQFYLLWPVALASLGVLRARYCAAFIVVASPFYRLVVWSFIPAFVSTIDRRFDCIADCIAIGCLLAGAGRDLAVQPRYMSFLKSPVFGLVPVAVIAASLTVNHPKIYYGAGETVVNIGLALVIHRSVLLKESLSGVLLNSAPVAYVGTLSYSLYLWQQPFLSEQVGSGRFTFPLNLLLACGAALLSFYIVEQPLRSAITARFQKGQPRVATPGVAVP